MKYEYKSGRGAKQAFEDAMKTIFKAPKTVQVKQRPKKAASDSKTDVPDKDA